eukprot:m51a1_g9602 putative rna polymerase ii core subunit (124) ;mRNA; r:1050905-1051399
MLGDDSDVMPQAQGGNKEAITLMFCNHCNNMMKPQEVDRRLIWWCAACEERQESKSPCVYRHDTEPHRVAAAAVTDAVDPTLPRTTQERCQNCHKNEAAFCPSNEPGSTTRYVCVFCRNTWVN